MIESNIYIDGEGSPKGTLNPIEDQFPFTRKKLKGLVSCNKPVHFKNERSKL